MLALGNLSNDWSYIQIISKNMKTRKRNKRTSSQDAPKNTTETSDQSTRVDFIDVMDTWCDGATKKKILSQYTFYREKRGLFSTMTLSQVLDKILTIYSLGGATSVAKYLNYRVLQ